MILFLVYIAMCIWSYRASKGIYSGLFIFAWGLGLGLLITLCLYCAIPNNSKGSISEETINSIITLKDNTTVRGSLYRVEGTMMYNYYYTTSNNTYKVYTLIDKGSVEIKYTNGPPRHVKSCVYQKPTLWASSRLKCTDILYIPYGSLKNEFKLDAE